MMTAKTEQQIERLKYEAKTKRVEVYKTYHVTGVLRDGKRFRCMVYHNYMMAVGINLWRGSVWEVTDGKRKLLKRVYN